MKAHVVSLSRGRQWMIFVCCVSFLVVSAGGTSTIQATATSDLTNPNDLETSSDRVVGEEATVSSTPPPTAATPPPTNVTSVVPTIAPSNETNITTFSPTIANTSSPTATPVSPAPTVAPSTLPPSPSPTSAPSGDNGTKAPSNNEHKGLSFLRFVEKTIAYLILLVLALLGFGAFMANRYRIYFFLRGVWYTILQMECTLWVLRKLGVAQYFGYQAVDTSLNSSIFENELNEGLLMRETDT